MFDKLKSIAMQKLVEKMASNALSSEATSAAAEQGSSAIIESIKSKISGGGLEQVTALFSGSNLESNGLFQEAKQKMVDALQNNGMSAEEAQAEAENTTPDLIASLKDKFASQDEADKDFDLNSLTKLIPGDAGDLLNKAKSLF
jgi:cytochrome c551/c552